MTLDNSLWGFIKEEVQKSHYSANDELQTAVHTVFQKVTSIMLINMNRRTWRRIRLRRYHEGEHMDVFDL
jgi:hypothetical protein